MYIISFRFLCSSSALPLFFTLFQAVTFATAASYFTPFHIHRLQESTGNFVSDTLLVSKLDTLEVIALLNYTSHVIIAPLIPSDN